MKEEIVLLWLKKAENDLKIVECLVGIEDAPADVLCFHCQQAVEKCLKAYLTWIDVRVRKTHDMENILNLCIEKDKEFKTLDRDKISKLTIYATETRYPGEYIEATIEEARDFYELANKVKDFVIERLKATGLERLG